VPIAKLGYSKDLASKMKLFNQAEKHSESPKNSFVLPACGCSPVLVVDDNEFNIYTNKQMLKTHFKLRSDTAYDGQQAVDKFRQSLKCCPYRLIFMDINMPVMDGHEATRTIREIISNTKLNEEVDIGDLESQSSTRQTTTKIYALTANNDKHEHDEAVKSGMDGFLTKPTDFNNIKQVMQSVFGEELYQH